MLGKYNKLSIHQPRSFNFSSNKSSAGHIRSKLSEQFSRKFRKRQIYGEHYNYHQVGLNKEKKYMLEEERNTEIERANRILLEKIRKIGQRSVQLQPRPKVFTEASQEQEALPDRKSNQYNFYNRKQSSLRSTYHHLTKSKFSDLSSHRKSSPLQKKILFSGNKQIDGIQFSFTIYIQEDMYVIYSQQGNMEHKIQMSLQHYKILLRQSLNDDHNNIFDMLTFNGALLELKGTKKKNISVVQDQELTLPLVTKPQTAKHRFQTQ